MLLTHLEHFAWLVLDEKKRSSIRPLQPHTAAKELKGTIIVASPTTGEPNHIHDGMSSSCAKTGRMIVFFFCSLCHVHFFPDLTRQRCKYWIIHRSEKLNIFPATPWYTGLGCFLFSYSVRIVWTSLRNWQHRCGSRVCQFLSPPVAQWTLAAPRDIISFPLVWKANRNGNHLGALRFFVRQPSPFSGAQFCGLCLLNTQQLELKRTRSSFLGLEGMKMLLFFPSCMRLTSARFSSTHSHRVNENDASALGNGWRAVSGPFKYRVRKGTTCVCVSVAIGWNVLCQQIDLAGRPEGCITIFLLPTWRWIALGLIHRATSSIWEGVEMLQTLSKSISMPALPIR